MSVAAIGDNISDCYLDAGQVYPGGNAVNVAVSVARAGGRSGYVGAVGTDERGRLLRTSLTAEGVDVSRLRELPGRTALAVVAHRDGERIFGGVDRGVALFTPSEEDLAYLGGHSVVHTTYCSGLEQFLPRLAEVARLSFDFDTHTGDGYADELLPYVWIAEFSASHLDEDECDKLLHWAQERGPQYVLATRGTQGALLFDGTDTIAVRAPHVQAVDTLGAGDACIGRLLHGLDSGEAAANALPAAVQTATAACLEWGAFGHGVPLSDEIQAQVQGLRSS